MRESPHLTTGQFKSVHLLKGNTCIFDALILHETVTLAATSDRILVKIDEFEFAERLEHLLDIALGQIEVKRTDVKSGSGLS